MRASEINWTYFSPIEVLYRTIFDIWCRDPKEVENDDEDEGDWMRAKAFNKGY